MLKKCILPVIHKICLLQLRCKISISVFYLSSFPFFTFGESKASCLPTVSSLYAKLSYLPLSFIFRVNRFSLPTPQIKYVSGLKCETMTSIYFNSQETQAHYFVKLKHFHYNSIYINTFFSFFFFGLIIMFFQFAAHKRRNWTADTLTLLSIFTSWWLHFRSVFFSCNWLLHFVLASSDFRSFYTFTSAVDLCDR